MLSLCYELKWFSISVFFFNFKPSFLPLYAFFQLNIFLFRRLLSGLCLYGKWPENIVICWNDNTIFLFISKDFFCSLQWRLHLLGRSRAPTFGGEIKGQEKECRLIELGQFDWSLQHHTLPDFIYPSNLWWCKLTSFIQWRLENSCLEVHWVRWCSLTNLK